MNKFYRSVIFAMALATFFPLFAASPRLPQVTTKGYINGKMNFAVWHKNIDYTYNNVKACQNADTLTCSYLIEMKGENESQWTDVTAKGSFHNFIKNNFVFMIWTMPTNYIGSAQFRIKSVDNNTAETSEWVDIGTFKTHINATGTPIIAEGCNLNGFDGLLSTMVDATGNSGLGKYIGYVFDEPTRIKAIRFVPRLDHMTLASRYRGSVFQVASDETFSDATTIHTISDGFTNIDISEIVFDEPITAKAIRHYKEGSGYESTAELEFISADMPLKPTLRVTPDNIRTYDAKAQWSFPEQFICSTCRLERAISKNGPWVPQTEWLDPSADELSFTGKDLYVGIPYYYRVAAVTEHPDYKGDCIYSKVAEYTRLRRLDRSWDDETKLYEGITVMTGTNGAALNVVNGRTAAHVFDGNADTFADLTQSWNSWGPIGLDFGEKVFVKDFGYICRHDNACYARVKYAALFSSDSDNHELKDKVQRSDNISKYSQDATFYTGSTTSSPADGARKWFLYATYEDVNGRFYGNIAELAFFGWTAADIAAVPVVTPPTDISFSRGASGPIISWTSGNLVETYTLKRRLRGSAEWIEVAELQKTETSFTETNLEQGIYEYCITVDGGELGVVTSNVFTYPWYIAGDGEGLSATVVWPYDSTSILPQQLSFSESIGNKDVNINLEQTEEIVSGVSSNARIVWEGKLIVPFDGLYTFSAETIGGAAVAIDDTFTFNSWTDGAKTLSGSINLTAGEHDIRVDYRTDDSASAAKKLILKWSGPVKEEIIPITQLIPATVSPSLTLDGWMCQSYNMNAVGQFVKRSDGSYKITSSNQGIGNTPLRASFMNKKMTGSYHLEAYINRGNSDGFGGLMIQSEEGYYIMPYLLINGANSYYGVKVYSPGSQSWQNAVTQVQLGDSSNFDCYLRIEKRGKEIKCFWKDLNSDPWTEIVTYNAPSGMFGFETFTGFTTCGNSTENPSQYIFDKIDLREIDSPTLIILK